MEKQDILDYVLKTPENTNPAILRGMLDQLEESSSGGGGGEVPTITYANLHVSEASNNIQGVRILVPASAISQGVTGIAISPDITLEANRDIGIMMINGALNIMVPSGVTVVSGNAELITADGLTYLHITGDCTIGIIK